MDRSNGSALIRSYFNLVGQKRRLQRDIKFKEKEIRGLEIELRELNAELEGRAAEKLRQGADK
jgi:hypothetical protein